MPHLGQICGTSVPLYCQRLAALLISTATGSFYMRSIALEGMYFLLNLVLFAPHYICRVINVIASSSVCSFSSLFSISFFEKLHPVSC